MAEATRCPRPSIPVSPSRIAQADKVINTGGHPSQPARNCLDITHIMSPHSPELVHVLILILTVSCSSFLSPSSYRRSSRRSREFSPDGNLRPWSVENLSGESKLPGAKEGIALGWKPETDPSCHVLLAMAPFPMLTPLGFLLRSVNLGPGPPMMYLGIPTLFLTW